MQPDPSMRPGSVVQVHPDNPTTFAARFILVTEVKTWGVQGFVTVQQGPQDPPGRAYVRIKWEEVEYVGPAAWVPVEGGE